jgi:hypothetical protein
MAIEAYVVGRRLDDRRRGSRREARQGRHHDDVRPSVGRVFEDGTDGHPVSVGPWLTHAVGPVASGRIHDEVARCVAYAALHPNRHRVSSDTADATSRPKLQKGLGRVASDSASVLPA